MKNCAAAIRDQRAVVIRFERSEMGGAEEYRRLFSRATRIGVLFPFVSGPGTEGILVVGEERRARGLLVRPEGLAVLEFVARRSGDLLHMGRLLEQAHAAHCQREIRRAGAAERRRLSRELHDGVGQALTALLVRLRWATSRGIRPDDLLVVETTAQDALDATRALAHHLRGSGDGLDPLEGARRYAERTLRDAGCRLSWMDERTDGRRKRRVPREIAEVIKESIANIARHAQADSVQVRLASPGGRLRVTVLDNGIGFESEQPGGSGSGRGTGLVGNAERLAEIGGTFEIRTAPQGGTLVVAEVRR